MTTFREEHSYVEIEMEISELHNFEPDPALECMPQMSRAELEMLALDIQTFGQLEPIIAADQTIIDGRQRLRACELAGLKPRVRLYQSLSDYEMASLAISYNGIRRHLSSSPRLDIAAEYSRPLMDDWVNCDLREIAAGFGVDFLDLYAALYPKSPKDGLDE